VENEGKGREERPVFLSQDIGAQGKGSILRGDHLGHLAGINDDVPHRESADEDRNRDDPGDPGIMVPQFHMFDVMGDQFVDLKTQREDNSHSNRNNPKKEGEFASHDQMNGLRRASRGDIKAKDKEEDSDD